MSDHHRRRPTVEIHHPTLNRTITVSPGAARVLKASGWQEPSEESIEAAEPVAEIPEVIDEMAEFSPEED